MKNSRLRAGLVLGVVVAAICVSLLLRQKVFPPAASSARDVVGVQAAKMAGVAPAAAAAASRKVAPASAVPRSVAAAAPTRAEVLAQIAAFDGWLTAWRRAEAGQQTTLTAAGRELAMARRTALKRLIETDPQLALERAIPEGFRAEMPAEVRACLEERIDGRGTFEVQISCGDNETRTDRAVVIGDQRYAAYTFGRRDQQTTKFGVPLHGMAIDGAVALAPLPYRELDPMEKAQRGFDPEQIVVLVGDRTVTPNSSADLQALSQRLIAAEDVPGPHVQRERESSGAPTAGAPEIAAVTSPQSWIFGDKRVLWVKVDFSDSPGAVATDEEIAVTNATVTEFYRSASQGKTGMTFSVLPAVLRLPRDKAFYNTSSTSDDDIAVAAKTLAQQYDAANGGTGAYDPDKYDRWIVLFSKVPIHTFAGRAQLGGPRVKMHGTIAPGTVAHELGHTQSLDHSHYWLPATSSAIGAGAHVEYGDVFDTMGSSGSSPNNFFNVSQQAKLGYLAGADINAVGQNGTYRVARHDHRDAAGVRALKVTPGNVEYEYWFEYRQFGPTAFNPAQFDRERNGLIVHWGPGKAPRFTSGPGSYLVDGTAGSTGGANDSPLRIGETFVDPDAGLTIKPLAAGGTGPNEYLDVQVSFGAIDGNRNPALAFSLPAGSISARTNLTFTANASDPDGDAVYYRWDFGDGRPQPSLNTVTTRYTKGGTYTLAVSAHDGRGGIDAKKFTVAIADPLVNWTQRGSGVTSNTLYAADYNAGRFVVVGDASTVLSSRDGLEWTRATTPIANNFYRGVTHSGTRFVTVGPGPGPTDRGAAAYSDDGATWTASALPANVGTMNGVAFGAGRFVAVGETGRIYTSTDGTTFTEVASPVTNALRTVAFASGLFVASGDAGRVLTSADGLTWNNRSVPTTNSLGTIAFHNGAWYASSATLECFTSGDGETWTRIATTGRPNTTLRLMSTSGVLFGATTNGSIALTEQPRNWATHQITTAASTNFNGAIEGNGTIVLVGSRGLIYTTSVAPISPPPLPAPSLRFEADSLKVSVGKKNVLSATGQGFAKLELYANGAKVSEINGTAGAFMWTPAAVGSYSLVVRGVAATGESVVSEAYAARASLARWTWRNPSPVGADLTAVARVDGKWWVVGRSGAFLTVADDGTVARVDFPTTQHLTGISYANGRFLVTGGWFDSGAAEDIGPLWTSTDGYLWTLVDASNLSGLNLNFVAYGGGRWLVGNVNSILATSTDGITWTRQVNTLPANTSIRAAVFGDGTWVAVCAGGRIISSPDAVRWTERTSGITTDLNGVTYANGAFVAVGASGAILRSTDTVNWSRATSGTTNALNGVGIVAGSFVAAGDSGVTLVSPDGTTWTRASLEGKLSGGLAVTGSGDSAILAGRAGEIFTATNASTWKRLTTGTGENRMGIVYAGGRFVVPTFRTDPIANTTVVPILVSTDGVRWSRANGSTALNAANLYSVAYAQNLYVAVGDGGRIFTSTNATDWTAQTSGVSTTLSAVTAAPNGFVAAGSSGAIVSSPDGTSWTVRSSGITTTLNGAAFGAGRFVLVGNNGAILQSADGATWTTAASGVTATLITTRWFDNIGFLAAGNSGTMLSSTDGVTWQQVETGTGNFIATLAQTPVGVLAGTGSSGNMILSLDGNSWSIATNPADRSLNGLAASPSTIVAVGSSGTTVAFDFVDNTPPPAIAAAPTPQTVLAGGTAVFSVAAQNVSGGVYQWSKDGQPIPGANRPAYTITSAGDGSLGNYAVTITTPTGTVTSAAAELTFANANQMGRLINLSLLTSVDTAGDTFTMGAVVGGAGTAGTKPLLVRAVGPALGAFNLANAMRDPALEFYSGTTLIGQNDNWGGGADLRTAFAAVGAFPFSDASSRDAAIYNPSVAAGNNSVKVLGVGGATGAVLAELYDATPDAAFATSTPRLVNVSVLKHLGSGVTVGFVIGGSTPRKVLVRAIGPTLGAAPFNVGGVVADPQLALFAGPTQIAANDNWGGTTALTATFAQLAAFALPVASRDAALQAELQPGSYTVQVSGVGGTSGVALIEVYEVP